MMSANQPGSFSVNQFRDRLYDAYGVCSYLSAYEEDDLQDMLNKELLKFALLTHKADSPVPEEMAACMLFKNGEDALSVLEHLRLEQRVRPKQKIEAAPICLSEFEWAEKRMRLQNPSLGYSPLMNLYELYQMICPDQARDQNALKPLKEAALHMSRGQKHEQRTKSVSSAAAREDQPQNNESGQTAETGPSLLPELSLSREGRKETLKKVDAILGELDRLTGLEDVKTQVHELSDYLQLQKIRQDLGLKNPPISRHMIFYGNPGTGKTTVARLLAKIYRELGLLKTGQLVETDRSGLVAGYIGQTAQKTQEVIKKALGGILFIDEAYALVRESPNDFGKEAVETLLKAMEDHRDDLVVIAAGYPKQMDDFLAGNPGLASRFGTRIHFENYTPGQLREIAAQMAEDMDYAIEEDALDLLEQKAKDLLEQTGADFGNARTIRNLIEKAMMKQAQRLMKQEKIEPEEIRILKKEDFEDDR